MTARALVRVAAAMVVASVVGVVANPGPAAAQDHNATESVRFEESNDNAYQIVGRARTVGVPNFLLNAFYEEHSANWRNGHTNMSYGVEFVWRKVGAFEMSAAVDYADLSMPDDMWLEAGKDPRKADLVEFNLGLASLVFSGYYYWEITDWFAPYLGGGLGAAMVLGDVTKRNPKKGSDCRSTLSGGGGPGQSFGSQECRNDSGGYDESDFEAPEVEDRIPMVIPMVNITTGTRFNIGKHGVVKLEVGFYDYLFAGISAGAQW